MNKLRLRILTKLAQTQPAQPTEAPITLKSPTEVPTSLFTNLDKAYRPETAGKLRELIHILNEALHYASQGEKDFTDLASSSETLSAATSDYKNIGLSSKRFFSTFLNSKNAFNQFSDGKVPAATIHNWSDALINSSEFNSLTQVKPSSNRGVKIGDIRTKIKKIITDIKLQNPITA
jgi:hypothetical protein